MKRLAEITAEELYEQKYLDTPEERLELSRHKGGRMRLKTIKSGDMLEAEIYPVWDNTARCQIKHNKRTEEEERRYYDARRRKYLARLINTNFSDGDVWATLTYRDGELPADIKAAEHELEKFIRRLAYYVKKHNLPALKYVAATEEMDRDGKYVRVHHHIFINFRDRDELERIWGHDDRPETRRLKADDNGYNGAAFYTMKNIKGKKSYRYSQNLKNPTTHIADSKITARIAMAMAIDRQYCEEKLRKIYQGYEPVAIEVKTSAFVSGFYIYGRFRKLALNACANIDTNKPTALTHEQLKRLRNKLGRIAKIKKVLNSLERELKQAKTNAKKNVKAQITRLTNEHSRLTVYFNRIAKQLDPIDRTLLRERFIGALTLSALADKYHYGDKSVVARKIDKILSSVKLK